jgi:polysaccharide export outer membrane protein
MLPKALTVAGLALLWAGAVAAQSQDVDYSTRPGDRVTIRLFTAAGVQVDVVGGERTIDRGGDIFLPYVGTVQVAGLDQGGIRDLLTDRYGEFYSDPVVDVVVRLKISVTGAVPAPGQFYLDPTATVAEALAVAGGATPEFAVAGNYIPSDPTRVRLVRDGRSVTLNFRAQEVSQETLDIRIRSGDWVHVPYQPRSRIRDEVQFWSGVVSLTASVLGVLYLTNVIGN